MVFHTDLENGLLDWPSALLSTSTVHALVVVIYMHLLLQMLGIYVVVITLLSLLSFTCSIERITLQEMWKYYQASGGYSIVINVYYI